MWALIATGGSRFNHFASLATLHYENSLKNWGYPPKRQIISDLQRDVGKAASGYWALTFVSLPSKVIELDEVWSFRYSNE